MTSMQIPWAPGAQYLRLTCRLGEPRPDGDDQDTHPDLMTQAGSVTLRCGAKQIRYKESDGHYRMLSMEDVTFSIRPSDGELFSPATGAVGVEVLSGLSSGIDPAGFTWTATVKPERGDPWPVTLPADLTGEADLVELASSSVLPTPGTSTSYVRTVNGNAPDGKGNVDVAGGGSGASDYSQLTGVPTSFTPKAHAATHAKGGSDPIALDGLKAASLDTTKLLAPDGAGGVQWVSSPSSGTTDYTKLINVPTSFAPSAHATTHSKGGADALTVTNLAAGSTDPSKVLAPTAAGGLQWVAAPTGSSGSYSSSDIIAAGRPDITTTLDSATQAAVANATSGTLFRSTDGAGVGAWAWMKQGAKWVPTAECETPWIPVTSEPSITAGKLQFRRVRNELQIVGSGLTFSSSGTKNITLQAGFRLVKAASDVSGGPIVNDSGGSIGKVTFYDGSLLQVKVGTAGSGIGFTLIQPGIADAWPSTLPTY